MFIARLPGNCDPSTLNWMKERKMFLTDAQLSRPSCTLLLPKIQTGIGVGLRWPGYPMRTWDVHRVLCPNEDRHHFLPSTWPLRAYRTFILKTQGGVLVPELSTTVHRISSNTEKSLQDGVGQRQTLVRPLGMHWWLQADKLCKYRFQRVRQWARQSWSCQFSSVVQRCPTLCDPMDCSTPGLPVHHQLPEFTQIHVHWVGDAIQPSHPLLSPSPATFHLSQYQGLFQWVSSSHQVAKGLEFQLQHQSFQWLFRTDFL